MNELGLGTVGQNEFLQLLVAQLQNQDPLEPVEDTEFISQLATFSQLESLQQLNASFSQILQLQELSEGANLIGKEVSYVPEGSSESLSGTVSKVLSENGKIFLEIDSELVSLNQITEIR